MDDVKPIVPIIIGTENKEDEADILDGENQNDKVISGGLNPIEDEPTDFMRGEVDVKTQMDRALRKQQSIA